MKTTMSVKDSLLVHVTQKVAIFKTVHIHIIYKTPTFLTLNMLVIATVYQEQVQDKVDRIYLHYTPLADATPGNSILPATHPTTIQPAPQPGQGGGVLAGTHLSLRCSWTGRSFETEPSCL